MTDNYFIPNSQFQFKFIKVMHIENHEKLFTVRYRKYGFAKYC